MAARYRCVKSRNASNLKHKTCAKTIQRLYYSKSIDEIEIFLFRSRENDRFANLKLQDLVTVKTFAEGAYGRLELAHIKNEPTRCFALKKVKRSRLTEETNRRKMLSEKAIFSGVKNAFIAEYHRTFRSKTHLYIMMEWCPGGDLSVRGRFDEAGTRFYVGCIAEALEYLHSKNIVHRDLKPRNLVLDNRGYLKLIDFGIAKQLEEGERTTTFCGTIEYCAPEMLRGSGQSSSYDTAVDLWTLGLMTYEFLTGKKPMYSPNRNTTWANIVRGIDGVAFPDCVSREAVDFIKQLCRKVPEQRLGYGSGGFDNLRNHSWLRTLNVEALRSRTLIPPIVPTLDGVTDTRYFPLKISEEKMDDSLDSCEFDPNWAKDF